MSRFIPSDAMPPRQELKERVFAYLRLLHRCRVLWAEKTPEKVTGDSPCRKTLVPVSR